MSGRDYGRDNLVLSMTLAEIFLLLLFVVWWSSQIPFVVDGQTLSSVQIQARNKELRTKVDTLTMDNARLAKELGVLKRLLAIGDKVPVEKFPGAVQDALDAARRGHPKCAEQNVLVDVRVEDGVARMTFLQRNDDVLRTLPASVRQQISSREALREAGIVEVLRTVGQVYRERRARGSDCRFDYHLGYVTDSDYVTGRERFEKVFYAGGRLERTTRRNR